MIFFCFDRTYYFGVGYAHGESLSSDVVEDEPQDVEERLSATALRNMSEEIHKIQQLFPGKSSNLKHNMQDYLNQCQSMSIKFVLLVPNADQLHNFAWHRLGSQSIHDEDVYEHECIFKTDYPLNIMVRCIEKSIISWIYNFSSLL